MPNVSTVVESRGCIDNIIGSIVGALFGIVLFFASFGLIFWNEGRTNLAKVAKQAVVAKAESADPAVSGKLVSVTGKIDSKDEVGDPSYVKPGAWIHLVRHAETWAWKETAESHTEHHTGGSSTTTTTYSYSTQWVSSVPDSSSFHDPSGHENPRAFVEDASFEVAEASIGAWTFSPAQGEGVDADAALELTSANTLAGVDSSTVVAAGTTNPLAGRTTKVERDGNTTYLFIGKGTFGKPELGDARLRYNVAPRGALMTLFGEAKGSSVVPFKYEEGSEFMRALNGTREEAIHELAVEDMIIRWLLRGAGFLCMWFGMTLVLGPLEAVANVLPFAGKATRAAIGCATFPIAAALTTVTVIVSMILHSLVAMIVVGVVGFGIAIAVMKMMRKSPAAGTGVAA